MKSRSEFSSKEEYLNYLRVYYAGLAMQGYISAKSSPYLENLARFAVQAADTLIAELNKDKS